MRNIIQYPQLVVIQYYWKYNMAWGFPLSVYVSMGGENGKVVMDYDEACFMHLTPGVVHNFPKAVGV